MNQYPKSIVVDFDGIISEYHGWKGEFNYGKVIKEAYLYLKKAKETGYKIIIFTSRNWIEHTTLEKYLNDNNICYDMIICGKPIGDIYIDDRAINNWDDLNLKLKSNLKKYC